MLDWNCFERHQYSCHSTRTVYFSKAIPGTNSHLYDNCHHECRTSRAEGGSVRRISPLANPCSFIDRGFYCIPCFDLRGGRSKTPISFSCTPQASVGRLLDPSLPRTLSEVDLVHAKRDRIDSECSCLPQASLYRIASSSTRSISVNIQYWFLIQPHWQRLVLQIRKIDEKSTSTN